MKYNLNLTRDYCAHWNKSHALRELIANNIDEGGKLERLDLDGSEVADAVGFTTEKIMPIEAFLMGYSVKSVSNPIGQFGEGLKIAMLILERENHYVEFFAGPYQYMFSFETPEGFGVETLHITQVEVPERINETNTVILVHGVDQKLMDSVYTDKPVGSVFVGRGLYCQGLLVEPNFYIKIYKGNAGTDYGVNLDAALSGNRDRNYYDNKEKIVPLLEQFFKPEDFFDFTSSWYNSSIFQYMSDEFAQRFCKAVVNKDRPKPLDLSDVRVLLTNDYSSYTRYGRKDGYYVGPYHSYSSYLHRGDDSEVLSSLKIDVSLDTLKEDTSTAHRKLSLKRAYYLHKELSSCKTIHDLATSVTAYIPMLAEDREAVTQRLIDVVLYLTTGVPLPDFYYADTISSNDVKLLSTVVKELEHQAPDEEDEDDNE